ncbi:MAG: 7-carboxy-7-deazaguanine synthase QueE [Gammaproteobacteria bacterium]|nr:7-carboxy-7-deazaguanine synthase QueE [Pseudomonadota bacterium]MCH8958400.1 7-carboxy-7-deazaguanine synthase QueE [Pseudomonadota bacterium]MCZ6686086.1 7-carboxy-7-deazaguanine synthase QueE [Gammaproteobacteria bacterium]MCZ6716384.1 7-carboxy-7-deazaguanine synthase QueE [Gammaproteobacteria bacterium]
MADPARDDLAPDTRLRITEIFYSLQGEADTTGAPTVFIRLTGCPLRCQYCDTAYAFHGGRWMDFASISEKVREYGCRHVCVTGGEPLAQKNCAGLLRDLCDNGYRVSLETSGAADLSVVDPRVVKVMDLKTPGSGEVDRNLWQNLDLLSTDDQIKFVICSRADLEWAGEQVRQRQLDGICTVWFSPSYEQIKPVDIADWILQERLPVRLQLQLHKYLWGTGPGH